MIPAPSSHRVWAVLAALLATGGLGWVEDFSGVPISIRAGIQAATGGVITLVWCLGTAESWWWVPVGVVAVIGLVNVVNFMDGVNTMSAAHGVIAGGAFAVVGALHDTRWLIVAGLALSGAFLAFIPWNFNGRLFLGDVGSYLLGGTAAIIIVLAAMDGLPIVAMIAPFVIYVADTGVTLIGRVLARERWYEAHRDHTYQRLNRRGMSHLAVTAVVATASLSTAALGVAASQSAPWVSVMCIAGIVAVAAVYTAVRFGIITNEGTSS